MHPTFKKLNLKDQSSIVVLNAPESFQEVCATMAGTVTIQTSLQPTSFLLFFATKKEMLVQWATRLNDALEGDGLLWIAYPKKSSKRYKSDITRDIGWEAFGALDFEGVRMVAIDEDWSALRFRRVDYIKKMRRDPSWAMTEKGKKKAKG